MARPRSHNDLALVRRREIAGSAGGAQVVILARRLAPAGYEQAVVDAAVRRVARGLARGERADEEFLRAPPQEATQREITRLGRASCPEGGRQR